MKKKTFYLIKLNKSFLIFSLIILFLLILRFKNPWKTLKIFSYNKGNTIVIDPGHGGIDGGTGKVDDILEKDINLAVGRKLKKELLVEGYNIVMTREVDKSLEEYSNLKASRYRRDLDARKTIVNSNAPLAFVSIHVNSSSNKSARGIKIYHYPKDEESFQLAEDIKASIDQYLYKDYLQEESLRTEILTEDYFILRETDYPGVLIEIGFITNPEEKELMKSQEYRERLAYAIKKGIVDFIAFPR